MKVAMWALGLLVLSLFGFVLVNLFGNITVTDQLNYTSMKNAVEAAMYDSLDIAHYRTGFCLCTNNKKAEGKWVFKSDEEYKLTDITYDDKGNETCSMTGMSTCELLRGEYRIKPSTFSESLVRRFAEMVNNNKDYTVTIQDIIEYPPKVSVRVVSKDEEFSPTEKNSGGYVISNQIDAIIETNKDAAPLSQVNKTPTPSPTTTEICCCTSDGKTCSWMNTCTISQPVHMEDTVGSGCHSSNRVTPTPTPLCCCARDGFTCSWMNSCTSSQPIAMRGATAEYLCKTGGRITTPTPKPTPAAGKCYYITKGDTSGEFAKDKYYWSKDGTPPNSKYEYRETSLQEINCNNVCHCNTKTEVCGFWANKYDSSWINAGWQRMYDLNKKYIYEGSSNANQCAYGCMYTEDVAHDVYRFDWGFEATSKGEVQAKVKDQCVNVCYCKNDNSKCGIYAQTNWDNWYVLKKDKDGNVDLEHGTVVTKAEDCYYHPKQKEPVCCYSYTDYTYKWEESGSCTLDGYTVYEPIKNESACQNACYCCTNKEKCNEDSYYKCGIYALWDEGWGKDGWTRLNDAQGNAITDENKCKLAPPTATPTPTPNGYIYNKDDCKWHAHMFHVGCMDQNAQIESVNCPLQSSSSFQTQSAAANDTTFYNQCVVKGRSCCSSDTTPVPVIVGEHYYDVYYYGTYTKACSDKHATSAANAIQVCDNCNNRNCVARCKG